MTTATDHPIVLDTAAQDLLFREAHTAQAFTDEPVTDAQLEAVYELVKFAPTAYNQQPLRILALRSEQARARLLPTMAEGNRAKVAAAPLTLVLAADLHFHEHLPQLFPHFPGAKEMFDADAQARTQSARSNALLQVGYLITGIRAAGLAAGPMTGFDSLAVDREFFPEGRHHSLVVVNLGTAAVDSWHPRQPRLAASEVITML